MALNFLRALFVLLMAAVGWHAINEENSPIGGSALRSPSAFSFSAWTSSPPERNSPSSPPVSSV
jgi:hypothetical protein